MGRSATLTGRLSPIGACAGLLLWSGLLSCATPVPPTGGPVDSTPPQLVQSDPAEGTVNFSGNSLTLRFSERIDAPSFQRALSITPEPTKRPRIRVKRNQATILLQEPLRDSTTYIFTLDNTLKDLHGVSLKQPIVMAIATGSEIDRGRLEGIVLHPETDRPVASLDVYAYAARDSVPADPRQLAPDFRTQTGTDGKFAFSYLPERPFQLIALEDRNRNRKPDQGEAFAVSPQPFLFAVRADSGLPTVRMFVTRSDTIPPEIRRIRSLSSRRLQIRYSEPVRLRDLSPDHWLLQDSAAARPIAVHAVLAPSTDPFVIVLITDSMATAAHRLTTTAVADSSGNPAASLPASVVPEARADTVRLRFRRFLPDPPTRPAKSPHLLAPNQAPGILLSDRADSTYFQRFVTLRDTTGADLPYTVTTDDGYSYTLRPTTPLRESHVLVASVNDPLDDTLYVRRFQVLPARERGELSGTIRAAESPVAVEIRPDNRMNRAGMTIVQADATGVFVAPDLPAAGYYVRAFIDRDGNRAWTGGRLHPYVPYEPLVWYPDSIQVRARWSTALSDTLVILSPSKPGGNAP